MIKAAVLISFSANIIQSLTTTTTTTTTTPTEGPVALVETSAVC